MKRKGLITRSQFYEQKATVAQVRLEKAAYEYQMAINKIALEYEIEEFED